MFQLQTQMMTNNSAWSLHIDEVTVNCSMSQQHRNVVWHLIIQQTMFIWCMLNVFCRSFNNNDLVNTRSATGMFRITFPYLMSCNKTYCQIIYYTLDITSSARSSTGACIKLLRCTFKICACQSQPPPVTVTCIQLLVVTYKSWLPKLLLSGPAVALRVPPNSGTAYHCHSAIQHWHLDNSAAGWKLICLV